MIGTKFDAEKLPWWILPWQAVIQIMLVVDFGAKKYERENWRKLENWEERYWSAAMRHLLAWKDGEVLDRESGLPHLAHAGCCLLFLLELDTHDK